MIGIVVSGKYELLSLLGSGGMSSVYKCKHLLINRFYALKLLHKRFVQDQNAILRFQQEATAASQLSHPNIITLFDFGIHDDSEPFQVIEYLEGCSVAEEIMRRGKLPLSRALHIARQACDAIQHAHSNGVIHRDLKPSNIMLISRDGDADFVKIVDFGIAKVLPQEGEVVQQLTQTGEIFGSPLYMSPEQCMGRRMDGRCDIYSLGCVLYEMLMGHPPLVGETVFETIQKHIEEMPKSVKTVIAEPRSAEQMDRIITKVLAKEPDQRYQTMAELSNALQSVQLGKSAGFFENVKTGWDTAHIKIQPKRKRFSLKVVLSLVALGIMTTAILLSACFLVPVKFKPYAITWPKFTLRAQIKDTTQAPNVVPDDNAIDRDVLLSARNLAISTARRNAIHMPLEKQEIRLRALARSDAYNGQYKEALGGFDQLRDVWAKMAAKHIPVDVGNKTARLTLWSAMGDTYYSADRLDEALVFYKKAILEFDDAAQEAARSLAMPMGDILYRQGNFAESAAQFKLACRVEPEAQIPLAEVQPANSPAIEDRALLLTLAGDALRQDGKLTEAEPVIAAAAAEWIKFTKHSNEPRYIESAAATYNCLGETQMGLSKFAQARKSFVHADELLRQVRDNQNGATVEEELAKACYAEHDYVGALIATIEARSRAQK